MIGLNNEADPVTVAAMVLLLIAVLCLCLALLLHRRRMTHRRLDSRPPCDGTAPSYVNQRDEMLATLGHELRSPLRALLGLLDTMQRPGEVTVELCRELRALASHALRVAEESLDFALLERDAVRLVPSRINLEAELTELLVIVRPLRPVGVVLELDVAPGLAVVRNGDGARLKQILVNLLANAFAHTEHGSVRVSVGASEHDPEIVRFVVQDSGSGMMPAERQRAFRAFEQGDNPRGRAGIGLAVVARIVTAMHGDVSLKSEPGLGSSFVVDLPLPALEEAPDGAAKLADRLVGICCARPGDVRMVAAHLLHWKTEVLRFPDPAALAAHLATDRPLDALVIGLDQLPPTLQARVAERESRGLIVARSAEDMPVARLPGALLAALTQRTGPASGQGALTGLKVLVVDDHPVVRRVLWSLLSELGCRVTCAEDGASAVEIAHDPEEVFDWVLLDRRMPGLDGLATAALLRAAQATRDARIALLVSDAADDPDSSELFDQVLVRPQHPASLRSLLALTLSNGLQREETGPAAPASHDLTELRDETLREDLEGLRAALGRGDDEAVTEHLHRMQGALRLCPDPALRSALATLKRAFDDGTAVAEPLRTIAEGLGQVHS